MTFLYFPKYLNMKNSNADAVNVLCIVVCIYIYFFATTIILRFVLGR